MIYARLINYMFGVPSAASSSDRLLTVPPHVPTTASFKLLRGLATLLGQGHLTSRDSAHLELPVSNRPVVRIRVPHLAHTMYGSQRMRPHNRRVRLVQHRLCHMAMRIVS